MIILSTNSVCARSQAPCFTHWIHALWILIRTNWGPFYLPPLLMIEETEAQRMRQLARRQQSQNQTIPVYTQSLSSEICPASGKGVSFWAAHSAPSLHGGRGAHTELFSLQGLEIMVLQWADKSWARHSQIWSPAISFISSGCQAAEHRKLKATHRSWSEAPNDLRQNLSSFPPFLPPARSWLLAVGCWISVGSQTVLVVSSPEASKEALPPKGSESGGQALMVAAVERVCVLTWKETQERVVASIGQTELRGEGEPHFYLNTFLHGWTLYRLCSVFLQTVHAAAASPSQGMWV